MKLLTHKPQPDFKTEFSLQSYDELSSLRDVELFFIAYRALRAGLHLHYCAVAFEFRDLLNFVQKLAPEMSPLPGGNPHSLSGWISFTGVFRRRRSL